MPDRVPINEANIKASKDTVTEAQKKRVMCPNSHQHIA